MLTEKDFQSKCTMENRPVLGGTIEKPTCVILDIEKLKTSMHLINTLV